MVTPRQLNNRAQLFNQLSSMISAGMPLTKALEMAAKNRASGTPQKVIQALIHYLQEGYTFSDAMQILSGQKEASQSTGIDITLTGKKAYWLTEFDIALLSAGEESGRLDVIFKVLSNYYETRAKIMNDTISRTFTTMATLHVFLIIFPLGYFVAFVLGIINNDYKMCLPFLFNKTLLFGALYGMISFVAYACQGGRGESWRLMIESIFSAIPILRTAIKYLAIARLSCALEALTNAGVPVVRSWELAASACGSPRLRRAIMAWLPQLETGLTPGDMVQQISYFPEMFDNLYNTAEISGKQDETLQRLHKYFQDEGFRLLQLFTRILTGFIYGIVVILVAINIIRFYMSYFQAAAQSAF